MMLLRLQTLARMPLGLSMGLTRPVLRAGSLAIPFKTVRQAQFSRTLTTSRPRLQADNSGSIPKSSPAPGSEGHLTWNEFLALRTRRRRVNVGFSVLSTIASGALGWGVFANVVFDPTEMIMGFDPFMVISLAVALCGAGGYLIGPSVGNVFFQRVLIRKQSAAFVEKETEFLNRIRINRPDPSRQSYANPVTDYYGEKIGSLKDYRRWLRDGRTYRKKAQTFL